MPRIFVVNSQTGETYRAYEQNPQGEQNVVQLVEVFDSTWDNPPTFDPATERLEQSFDDDLQALTRTRKKRVVALTQEQIDSRAQSEADDSEAQAIKAFWLSDIDPDPPNFTQADPQNSQQAMAQLIELKATVRGMWTILSGLRRVVKYVTKEILR